MSFAAGQTEQRFWVYIFDDSHDEDPETFEVELYNARGAAIADAVGIGTIVNSDPMPKAWLSRFGRTAAQQTLDAIAGRIAAPRTAGAQGTVGGQALSFEAGGDFAAAASDGFDRRSFDEEHRGIESASEISDSRILAAREALSGSAFARTGDKDGTGGSLALWGSAGKAGFDGKEGTFSLDGEVETAIVGSDFAQDDWLVGLALSRSEGEGGYRDTDVDPRPVSQDCPPTGGTKPEACDEAVRTGDGKVEASLTALTPYAALQASERLKLWGAAGYGSGNVRLKTRLGQSLKTDIDWQMLAFGLRGDVISPPSEGGLALALVSDALWTRTSSKKSSELAASDSDVSQVRFGLEGSYSAQVESGGSAVSRLSLGARHDGGDAESGFGIELGAGFGWNDPDIGLGIEIDGRALVTHGDDDLKDNGFSVFLAYDPDPAANEGPSFSLRRDWGVQDAGGMDGLFASAALGERSLRGETASRWQAEAAWGFAVMDGRYVGAPHVGLGFSSGRRDYTVGWRLTPAKGAPDLSLGIKATRRQSDAAETDDGFGLEVNARW